MTDLIKIEDLPKIPTVLADDVIIKRPWLKIIQGNSDLVDQGLAKPGMFQNSMTKEVYGNEIEVVPITFETGSQFMKNKKLECSSKFRLVNQNDINCKKCPHGEYFATKHSKCMRSIKTILGVIRPDRVDVACYVFASTSYSAGQDFLSTAYSLRRKQYIENVFKMTTHKVSNDKGRWIAPLTTFARKAQAKEIQELISFSTKINHDALVEHRRQQAIVNGVDKAK